MNKGIIAILVTFMFILAGCKSAFELPAGCDSDLQEVSQTPIPSVLNETDVQSSKDPQTDSIPTPKDKDLQTDSLPTKAVVEGDLVSFPNLKAFDPDGDKITYTFSAPLDSNGKWQTKVGDFGEKVVTITASDGKSKASQKIKIVVAAKNRAPVIQLIEDVVVSEGDTVKLTPVITDSEDDKLTVSYSGWMNSNTKATTFGDAGKYVVTVKATDGTSTVSKKVNVIVTKQNRAPSIEQINDVVIKEGDKMTVKPLASDADRDKLSFSFSSPLDSVGAWQTKVGDAGTYNLNVTVSDGESFAVAEFKVTVQSVNRPPVLIVKELDINVDEGDVVSLHSESTDADGDSVRISYSGWMTSDTYKTTFEDSGVHTVTVTATDGINKVTKDVQVTVRNVNRAPVFDAGSFD